MIRYSDEQAMLAGAAGDFMQRHSGFDAVRKRMASDEPVDTGLWKQMAELGWLGLSLPEQYGGAALPAGTLVSLCEPMGRYLFASPFVTHTLAGRALLLAGNEAQRATWLPRLADGSVIASVALTDEAGSWELTEPTLRAARDGAGYTLHGSKLLVPDVEAAGLLVVSAALEGAPALLLVERAALPAGAIRRETIIDEGRRCHRIDFDGVRIAGEALLDGSDTTATLEHIAQLGALMVAAEMTGGTEGVMQLTLEYLRTRTQFGRAIGSYQALKHPMVDIMIALEGARSLLYEAATLFDADPARAETAVRMAKAGAGDAFTFAADRAIQFHGGIGFTYECHAQLFFRRAQWAECSFGDARHHRRHLQTLLLDQDGFWEAADRLGPAGLTSE